jgi:DNA polymerase (family 10)
MDNQSIADAFSLLSKLMEIHNENSFKAKSYSIASYNIERLTVQLERLDEEQLFQIKGIGDAIGKKILELHETGEFRLLREMIDKTPPGILEMMQIKGLGPKKIALLWKELGAESLGELLYACNENRLTLYKGFGAKSQANIKENIEFFLKSQDRFLYAEIEAYALELQQALTAQFASERTELTGTFRRHMEIIDELEWCTTISFPRLQAFLEEQGFTVTPAEADKLIAKGVRNVPLIWYAATPGTFGTCLFRTSAGEPFLRAWEERTGPIPIVDAEEAVFTAAGLPFIIAPMRESAAIISLAERQGPPVILQPADIKGIIHSHSDWSDGAHTLEKMALTAKEQGFEYLVISDHSQSAFYANGLKEDRLRAQHEQIGLLNESLAPFKIFKSIESDILNDGRLDYSDTILATFDLVIASVHSNLRMPLEKAMQRLITALKNPFTTILGHPTGRLLLSRKGYPVDHLELLDVCAEQQVVMELNAHPRRLDMDWRWLEDALQRNVLTSIDPDAHAVEGFADIRYGVLAAQKAGITPRSNLSSFSRVELEDWLAARKRAKGI